MNIIENALFEITRRIPEGILRVAFGRNDYANSTGGSFIRDYTNLASNQGIVPVSMNARIRQEIVEKRVRKDCNLNGGTEVVVYLGDCAPTYLDQYNIVYQIPKKLTQNRSISQPLSVSIGQGAAMGTTNMGMKNASVLMDAASSVLASAMPIPPVSTAYIQLIDENTVLIQDNMALPSDIYLRCLLEADEMFSHLPMSAYAQFADMVELATKSYVYNKLVLAVDQARLSGGMELGRFRELLDNYADAEQMYRAYLVEVWQRVNILVDPEARFRHLRMIVGGAH